MHSQKKGAIAQLVEQRTENPCVPGSIPGGTTKATAICSGFFYYKYLILQKQFIVLYQFDFQFPDNFEHKQALIFSLNLK